MARVADLTAADTLRWLDLRPALRPMLDHLNLRDLELSVTTGQHLRLTQAIARELRLHADGETSSARPAGHSSTRKFSSNRPYASGTVGQPPEAPPGSTGDVAFAAGASVRRVQARIAHLPLCPRTTTTAGAATDGECDPPFTEFQGGPAPPLRRLINDYQNAA